MTKRKKPRIREESGRVLEKFLHSSIDLFLVKAVKIDLRGGQIGMSH